MLYKNIIKANALAKVTHTQKEISEKANITYVRYSDILQGNTQIKAAELYSLSKVFTEILCETVTMESLIQEY